MITLLETEDIAQLLTIALRGRPSTVDYDGIVVRKDGFGKATQLVVMSRAAYPPNWKETRFEMRDTLSNVLSDLAEHVDIACELDKTYQGTTGSGTANGREVKGCPSLGCDFPNGHKSPCGKALDRQAPGG